MANIYSDEDFDSSADVWIDGVKFRELRAAKWTQKQFAELACLGHSTIRQIELNRDPYTNEVIPKKCQRGTACRCGNVLNRRIEDFTTTPRKNKGIRTGKTSPQADELQGAAQYFVATCGEVIEHLAPAHPHLTFLAEYLNSLSSQIDISGRRLKTSIDAPAYRLCLSRFTDEMRQIIEAHADLTDPIEEAYWLANPRPEESWVHVGTFWLSWNQILERPIFDKLVSIVRNQANYNSEKYEVRLGILPQFELQSPHPLAPFSSGHHLLIMQPDLVGGYERLLPNQPDRHVLISEPRLFAIASKYYSDMKRHSIAVKKNCSEGELISSLFAIHNIGDFDPAWGEHSIRPHDYFSRYNINIRAWIPWYRQLNVLCSHLIQHEILNRLHGGKMSTNILEIGIGTGGLTSLLAAWISEYNRLLRQANVEFQCIEKYYGVDSAQQMLNHLPKDIQADSIFRCSRGVFGNTGGKMLTAGARMDILCGSLVLHDLLGTNPNNSLDGFLNSVKEYLREDGVLIMADVFISGNESLRSTQLTCWEQKMTWAGMTKPQIEVFLNANPEMTTTVTLEMLVRAANKIGFSSPELVPLDERSHGTIPFNVLKMRLRSK